MTTKVDRMSQYIKMLCRISDCILGFGGFFYHFDDIGVPKEWQSWRMHGIFFNRVYLCQLQPESRKKRQMRIYVISSPDGPESQSSTEQVLIRPLLNNKLQIRPVWTLLGCRTLFVWTPNVQLCKMSLRVRLKKKKKKENCNLQLHVRKSLLIKNHCDLTQIKIRPLEPSALEISREFYTKCFRAKVQKIWPLAATFQFLAKLLLSYRFHFQQSNYFPGSKDRSS